ncbi:hypothetical protein Slin15195_G056710 [Septoria linicola]|uniref:Ca2+-modulated nonselective cation channel polycystin n=1 Tax=Septoria linicola TaxID=215465 RepID=A0A9Q9EJM9_9PEZI|nr:hypothetical protein Slin14017_G072590 [Septoria linicola]USW52352.1 hypothetical protein Slin15195_G056710 [Septoria linicola]
MLTSTILAGLLAITASAAPNNAQKRSLSVYSTVDHITKYKPSTLCTGGALSTKSRTKAKTITSTITTCTAPTTVTTTVTPDAVTVGSCGNATELADSKLRARQNAACTTTTTVLPSIATVFTGEYNGTVAKRTASPVDRRSPALLPGLVHRLGQSALVDQKPFEVDCFHKITTYVYVTTTVAEQAITETVTAATPTTCLPQQPGKALLVTGPASISTTLTAPPLDDAIPAGGVCTVTESASSTTTQHLKCAPTNLISEVGGKGIGQTQGNESNTRGLAPGSDPSACCQLCVDTEGCAASEDDPKAGNCFLWYTEPMCGLGFKYSDNNQNIAPGAGFLVQTGCGYIEATEAPIFE